MIKKHFEAVVSYQVGTATIDLYGELTALATSDLEAAYSAAENQHPEVIRFNFSGVDYINSTGIALLVGLLIRSRQTSQPLVAYGLRPFYIDLFKLAGLTDYIPNVNVPVLAGQPN